MTWKRTIPEIKKEFEGAKEELAIFGHPTNRGECEGYYQYWRGVRNALMWVIYNMPDIRSDEAWEIGKEPKPLQADIEALAKAENK